MAKLQLWDGQQSGLEAEVRRTGIVLQALHDRWGAAGFLTPKERHAAWAAAAVFGVSTVTICSWAAAARGPGAAAAGAGVGAYLGLLAVVSFLRWRAADIRRSVLFELPIFLESIVLLVEAGLGVLPALERVAAGSRGSSYLSRVFDLTYGLAAAGIPFSDALRTVAEHTDIPVVRHTLLHLDISGSEGGELIPSLRTLANHAHTEWKLSVEGRVRRLENLVVFPVFVAVLGLMCLAAAVPLAPIMDFFSRVPAAQQDAGLHAGGSLAIKAFAGRQ